MKNILLFFCFLSLFISCQSSLPETYREVTELPGIFPDYRGVTVPINIAPLNFTLESGLEKGYVSFNSSSYSFQVQAKNGQFTIPASSWKKLLESSVNGSFEVTVYGWENEWIKYQSFPISVASEPVDSYLAYRLIEPGYELWDEMGIYQRNLTNYSQSAIMENKLTDDNCMNCHSFCMQDPEKMLFHMRDTYASTFLIRDNSIEKLNTKTNETISFLVYPSWHPSGKYVAFSVNNTKQVFHSRNANRVEVYDLASDVVVYDVEKHEIVTDSLLSSANRFETFPTFSPDGKTLYFCSAEAHTMPEEYDEVKYSLCALSFDPDKRTFGQQVDTLYNATKEGKSVRFPRVSPDGRFLMYTLSAYGNFSIWHQDADLHMVNLETGENISLDILNSEDVESYHSWSSNNRWVVFSSRRMDGLYTRPYIAYIDEQGNPGKPFLLPQKRVDFYQQFMKSYNIPEFITGKVKNRRWKISRMAKGDKGIDVKFAK